MKSISEKRLESAKEVTEIVRRYKQIHAGIVSNYVPATKRYEKWASNGQSMIYESEDCVFIVNSRGFMDEVIFISSSTEKVMPFAADIQKKNNIPLVIERVVRLSSSELRLGNPTCELLRMSRTNVSKINKRPKEIQKATVDDIIEISKIFAQYFNPLTERIPDSEELKQLIDRNGISLIKSNHKIVGMVIYEKCGVNIHLRYWWVSPCHRNQGLGSKLLSDFFVEGEGSKRQFLWVFSDNHDAIAKYRHYGFDFDGISDEIYVIQ